MHIEIEERVLEINPEEIIKRLGDLNATKVGEWNQKRYVYDFNPIRENEWIRLRTNGEKTTLTYKNIEKNSYFENYKKRLLWIGKKINIISPKGTTPALLRGIDENCRLIVKYNDNSDGIISSGEISIRKKELSDEE